MLRQIIYGAAAGIIGISSIWLLRLYYRSKADFLYWCCLGLMLITIGFTAGLFAAVLSDEISWLSRISLYFSGIYFIVAILVARAEAQTRGMEIHELISEFNKQAKVNYELLVNNASDAIIAVDGLGRILMWNPAAEKMFGYSRNEAIGSAFFDLIISPEHVSSYKKAVDIVALERDNTEPSMTMELKARKRNGEEFPVELTLASRKLVEEQLSTIMLILRDITGRKRAEKALQESEQKYRELVKYAPAAIYEVDFRNRRFISVNDAMCQMLGYTREELLAMNPFDLLDDRSKLIFRERITKWLSGETPDTNIEYIGKTKDGREICVILNVTFTSDANGQPIGATVIGHDITERKRAEEALHESEQRWSTTLASIGDAVISTDIEGRITFMNAEAEALTGWKLAEALTKPITEVFNIINEYTRREADNPVTKVLQEGTVVGLANHTILVRKGGTEVPIDDSGAPIKDGDGKTMGVVLVFRDITERKRAEEEQRESRNRFKVLTQNLRSGVALIDEQGKFSIVNPAFLSMFDLSVESDIKNVNDRNWAEWQVFDENGRLLDVDEHPVRKAALTGKPVQNKLVGVRPPLGKNLKWMLISAAPILKPDDRLEALICTYHNITERKQIEEALRKAHDELEIRVQERTAELKETNKALLESEASYRELTESIDDLFYAMDRELRYTYWNKASETLTGILAKDAVGKSLYELFPDIKGTKAEQFYIQALKMQKPERFESEYQLGDNKLIFEINAYPTKDGLSVIAKDITEKKNLESHLLRAQRMESIGTLAGGIAHDLNNMLTPIMMSLQMFKEKYKDEQSQRLLNILENNSQRSADLIKQVLSFARGVEGERNPLAAKHIITEIEKISKETFPRNIEIRTDIPKDLFTISGDATQLHQVIMNLCVNARDAMPDGGILSISAKNFFIDENYSRMHTEAKIGSYIIVEVSDTGTGIPPKILDRIFEPFFTTKEFGKGTGLGLSTALAIVKSHGGFINVNSEVGKGTTFGVYLPAIKTEIQSIDEKQPELLIGHGELVLVAEDEDSVREVTISTLEKNGYRVLTASDGVEAISSYAQNMEEIKVILMDMMMPVMDGYASIRAIRRINPEVKIISVSGLAEKDKIKNVAEYTNAFLPKPYTAEKLLKIMREVLNAK